MPVVVRISVLWCVVTLIGCANVREDAFFVQSSSLEEAYDVYEMDISQGLPFDQREFVVTGHRIGPGPGTVLAIRRFKSGSPLRTDQAAFEKLTVYLPKVVGDADEEFLISDDSQPAAFYSSSSSNFPGGSGCFGYASEGRIRIVDYARQELLAHIVLDFHLNSPGGWSKECGEMHLNEKLRFKNKSFEQLTPWDGRKGSHIYDETIP